MFVRVSLVALLSSVALASACNGDSDPVGAGGSPAGGTASGGESSGGTNSGGASGGTGSGGKANSGGAATGGSAGGRDCTPDVTEPAPVDGLITQFQGEGGQGGFSGIADEPFIFPPETTELTAVVGAGALRVNFDTTELTGLVLGMGSCIDATAFRGVRFALSGTLTGCNLKYGTIDVAHQDRTSGAPFATGPEGAYSSTANISSTQIAATPNVFEMPFVGVGAPNGGNPQIPIDKTSIIFVLWQVEPNGTTCTGDLVIDDVEFY